MLVDLLPVRPVYWKETDKCDDLAHAMSHLEIKLKLET